MKVRSVENRAEWTGNLGPFKTPGGGKNIIKVIVTSTRNVENYFA